MKDNKKNRRQICGLCFVSFLVRIGRLELPLREELDPKSSAATNYAISASDWFLGDLWDSNPRLTEPQSGTLPTELRSPYLRRQKYNFFCLPQQFSKKYKIISLRLVLLRMKELSLSRRLR